MSDIKKRYSPEEKAKILREHFKDQIPLGTLSEKYGIHPNLLYKWEKEFFEHAPEIFRARGKDDHDKKLAQENEQLKAKLKDRNDVIGEIIEDNIRLKKKLNGVDL